MAATSAAVSFMALAGCSSGYGRENRSLAEPVLQLQTITSTSDPVDKSYCTQDSCWLGADATVTSFEVEVDGDVQALADQITDTLPGWVVTWADDCGEPEADCGADNLIYANRDDQLIRLAFDEDGSGELDVDARSSAVQSYN